ncbi:MAG: phosphotransferase [Legionella sp. 40-6]|mgnify:CR=1 FL=1|nr:phosphotransferase [Legionella sp.]OJY54804.1 MAG: phosphotransferase [Legionella sp. 40-6]
MQNRENALKEWLKSTLEDLDFLLVPLAGDASFRRYFRAQSHYKTYVVMDAPPAQEDLVPFLYISKLFSNAQVRVPKIHAINLTDGFLLLEDLGDDLLLNFLTSETADAYYCQAFKELEKIQAIACNDEKIPLFNQNFMLQEMSHCRNWFLDQYLNLTLNTEEENLWEQSLNWIANEISQQPRCIIHRDFHSRNLMRLPSGVGVIDFQDAMQGPFTYDLVSLLKDCYIQWPREQVRGWVEMFYHQSTLAQTVSLNEYLRAFDLCGLQRHLKVLGIFSRLNLRDGKPGYLKDLPRTLSYVLECTGLYSELQSLHFFFQNRVYLP